jgi:hypothetical protein
MKNIWKNRDGDIAISTWDGVDCLSFLVISVIVLAGIVPDDVLQVW